MKYQYILSLYQYILAYTIFYTPVTGFRGGHRDATMWDVSQPPVEQCLRRDILLHAQGRKGFCQA